ncbi:ABC transporter ATP-binding protein [Propioniciclava coleopterorum]|uniref:ABC transporter ATP-binding protein n=1 Tax=Propioniciclava coleopterorum TaxID=2714937 RepID=UPI00197DF0E9|nr:ABC transporter ATP-binding protein [Propioniciclava coleopterorum]
MDEDLATGLSLRGITKRFGSFTAVDQVDLDVRPGEIHCLLGENGAGKSTLMNVLYGLLPLDGGEIVIDGTPRTFGNPRDAMAAGIGMVHQHFMLVNVFSVTENLMLGREGGPILDAAGAKRRVQELSERYGMPVDPDALIEDLPVGVQQRVEILKALANDARFLVFDEPTAVLTPQEIDDLMRVMQSLRDEGKGIVFITHKLREVRAIADRITVMRRGRIVGHAEPGSSEADLAELMVGRAVDLRVDKKPAQPTAPRLRVRDLRVANPAGGIVVDGIDFDVAGGEILCVAGVQGNGQSELADALLGNMVPLSGTIEMDGVDISRAKPRATIDAGMGFVPEDREVDGFVSNFTIAENLVLNRSNQPPFAHGMALDWGAINRNAEERKQEFDIRAQSVGDHISSLSGGNKQKVILARELSRPLSVLVASQPTRGVDVGAIEFLHKRIVEERDQGTAVLLVSTELEEVEALADRVLVMYRGKVVGIVGSDTPRDVMGLMMAGVPYDEAVAVAQDAPKEETHG